MTAGEGEHEAAVGAAMRALDGFMEAINAWDEVRLCEVLHFPHYRLSQGKMTVWEDATSYLRDFRDRAGPDWHDSLWTTREVVGASADKVHVNVEFIRRDPAGAEIARHRALWVVTRLGGVWRTQLRSSFGN